MKKVVKIIVSVILCICLMMPSVAFAAETEKTYHSVAEYVAESENENTFSEVLDYMRANNITLVGAVHDFTCPTSGKNYMFFPIRTI